MHDGRGVLALEGMGAELLHCPTAASDLPALANSVDSQNLFNGMILRDRPYAKEVCSLVRERTSADLVLSLNCIMRSSSGTHPQAQGAAWQVHVDFNYEESQRVARRLLDLYHIKHSTYSRCLMTSFWRPLSSPPQSVPLAICDGSTVADGDEVIDYMMVADPQPNADVTAEPSGRVVCESSLFYHNPAHRWYWIPDMHPDEALLFKLCDSNREGAWRVPHTAAINSLADADHARESVEFRTIAYFN